MPRRYFTLDEAQSLIPQLTAILSRSVQLHQLLRMRADSLNAAGWEVSEELLAGKGSEAHSGDEVLLAEAQGLYSAIMEDAKRIEELGGELKGPDLVDFWSWEDGRNEVLLCWRLGEREITWFHGADSGFAGRKPVGGRRFTKRRES